MSKFTDAVEHELQGVQYFSVGTCHACSVCNPENVGWDTELSDDDNFSWLSCESCSSTLGGNRYAAHGKIDNEIVHFEVCMDCLSFHANGNEPDN